MIVSGRVCIYNILQHDKILPVEERMEFSCKVIESIEIEKNIYLIKIKVPTYILRDLCEPGAYVFLKDKDRENNYFNAPISVMDIDEENSILEVVVVPRGIKTKPLVNCDEIIVKAPYFNGIFGLKEIKSNSCNKCVIVLDGLSQVNSINVIRRLIRNNNEVEVFINEKGKRLYLVEEKLKEMNIKINLFNLDNKKDELIISKRNCAQIFLKAWLIIVFGNILIFLIINRKDISNEAMLLLLCFIGGFLFHILWEGKSRYVIPYIVILIPLASVQIDFSKKKIKKICQGNSISVEKQKSN